MEGKSTTQPRHVKATLEEPPHRAAQPNTGASGIIEGNKGAATGQISRDEPMKPTRKGSGIKWGVIYGQSWEGVLLFLQKPNNYNRLDYAKGAFADKHGGKQKKQQEKSQKMDGV